MPSIVFHLLFYFLALSSAMASSSSSKDGKKRSRQSLKELMPAKDVRTLLRCGTKTGMCNALAALQTAGLLCTDDSVRKLRRTLQEATVLHGRQMTPYGTVIQQVDLRIPGIGLWEYCHPLAYLRYISGLNDSFGEVMKSCIEPGKPLTVILYMDELCPGIPTDPTMEGNSKASIGVSDNGPIGSSDDRACGLSWALFCHGRSRRWKEVLVLSMRGSWRFAF